MINGQRRDPIQVYDARWRRGDFDDREVARLVEATLAYGRMLDADTLVLARDARLAGPRVLEIAEQTAVRMGFRTLVRREPVSTPLAYFLSLRATSEHSASLGLMITASHNPREWIGVKFTVPPVQAVGLDCGPLGGLTKVRELYRSDRQFAERRGGTLVELDDPLGDFLAFATSQPACGFAENCAEGLTVVVDAMHGVAGREASAAIERAGGNVIPLRIEPNGEFPTGSPNPTSAGKMDRAVAAAAEHDADVVIGLDGDGDRIVFGDRRGILSAGFAALPMLESLAEQTAGSPVLYDPKVNPLALAQWRQPGVDARLFRNGHSQIKQRMSEIDAAFAAEESGHYYHLPPPTFSRRSDGGRMHAAGAAAVP